MARVTHLDYVEHRGKYSSVKSWRNWWLVKAQGASNSIYVGTIHFPEELLGKRVKIKIEVQND